MQRRRILIGILGILISGSIYAGLKEGESQLKAYSWFRYTYEQENAVTNMSEFAVKRGYLRWEHQFTNRIKSRFTVDFFTDDDYPDGAGIKIKDAYVDFNYLIPDGKIRIGLQANYFGHVYDWKGYTIERSFPNKENVVASRDFGISIGGNIIKDYGE